MIGIVGGMTWEATALYYERLNRISNARLGGAATARLLIDSLDFGELERLGNQQGDWEAVGQLLSASGARLEAAGAQVILLAAHTAHLLYDAVQRDVKVPLLHVLDPLSDAISNAGCQHVAVLGTRHVVESAFLLDRLRKRGIRAEPPSADQAQVIDQLIFSELAHGRFSAAARAQVGGIIASLGAQGFDSCALCCTELPVLLRGQVFDIPLFDTVELHVIAALDALGVQDSQQDSQRDSQHS